LAKSSIERNARRGSRSPNQQLRKWLGVHQQPRRRFDLGDQTVELIALRATL
jgi:hypothetical protein